MNIRKHLYLVAGLLALPVTANAVTITLNVPLDLTNVPASDRHVVVNCYVGVGAAPTTTMNGNWEGASHVGQGGGSVAIPANRNYQGTLSIMIQPAQGKSLDSATHYMCTMSGVTLPPRSVSGAIPR